MRHQTIAKFVDTEAVTYHQDKNTKATASLLWGAYLDTLPKAVPGQPTRSVWADEDGKQTLDPAGVCKKAQAIREHVMLKDPSKKKYLMEYIEKTKGIRQTYSKEAYVTYRSLQKYSMRKAWKFCKEKAIQKQAFNVAAEKRFSRVLNWVIKSLDITQLKYLFGCIRDVSFGSQTNSMVEFRGLYENKSPYQQRVRSNSFTEFYLGSS